MKGNAAAARSRWRPPFQAKPKPEGYVFGRPTNYRPEYCEQAIKLMKKGHSISGVAGLLSVSKDSIYDWINTYPDFCHAIKVGRVARVAFLETKLLTTTQGVGVTAAIFALKNADPDEYRDVITQDHNVNVTIKSVSDEQLLQIIGRSSSNALTIEHEPPAAVTQTLPDKPKR